MIGCGNNTSWVIVCKVAFDWCDCLDGFVWLRWVYDAVDSDEEQDRDGDGEYKDESAGA